MGACSGLLFNQSSRNILHLQIHQMRTFSTYATRLLKSLFLVHSWHLAECSFTTFSRLCKLFNLRVIILEIRKMLLRVLILREYLNIINYRLVQ